MSLALVAALALSPVAAVSHCSWDNPGADPFMGNVPAAVDRYTDIPADVRARLKERMVRRDFDEMATIRRDSITGRQRYSAEIRDMHFGQGRVCRTISRKKWSPEAVERGLVYCESEHCIIVPTVCRNVSRVKRLPGPGVETAGGPGSPGALPGRILNPNGDPSVAPDGTAGPLAANDTAEPGELVFDPPGAGAPSFSEASQPIPALPSLGGGTPIVPLAGTVGSLPPLAPQPPFDGGGGTPGGGFGPLGGGQGGSGLDVPPGVPPLGGGTVGGGGVPVVIPPALPPIDNLPPVIIDPVVPGIPEPSGWMLWLAGLVSLGWLARRRQPR
jgi:hypothetical protein